MEYLPFGAEGYHWGSTIAYHRYTDQEWDAETGLYNYNARLYDHIVGRFITPDSIVQSPFDPQTLNRYAYVRNNPLIFVDPSGHLGLLGCVILGAIIGGGVAAATGGDILMGMVTGAISGAIFFGAGELISVANAGASAAVEAGTYTTMEAAWQAGLGIGPLAQAGVHAGAGAISGGINAGITDGDVGLGMVTGAISGGFSKYAGLKIFGLGVDNFTEQLVTHSIIGGVVGGITAEIYGRSFGRGFRYGGITAAFGFLFNKAAHVDDNKTSDDNATSIGNMDSGKKALSVNCSKLAFGLWHTAEGVGLMITSVVFPIGVGCVATPLAGVAVFATASPAYATGGYLLFKHGLHNLGEAFNQ